MVEDPPIDLEEKWWAALRSPGSIQDPKGNLGAVLPVCGPLVSYVPDGDYSDRTNPADLCVPPYRETTVVS